MEIIATSMGIAATFIGITATFIGISMHRIKELRHSNVVNKLR